MCTEELLTPRGKDDDSAPVNHLEKWAIPTKVDEPEVSMDDVETAFTRQTRAMKAEREGEVKENVPVAQNIRISGKCFACIFSLPNSDTSNII